MPSSAPVRKVDRAVPTKAVIKVASVGHTIERRRTEPNDLSTNEPGTRSVASLENPGVEAKDGKSLDAQHTKRMMPSIDVTGEAPPVTLLQKKAGRYALRQHYPIDDQFHVKRAMEYFEEYGRQFTPEDRHEYCRNVKEAAADFGLQVSDEIMKCGSTDFAPDDELRLHIDIRRNLTEDGKDLYDELYEKRASLDPKLYCDTLGLIDRHFGIDAYYGTGHVTDNFYATFGFQKEATFLETIGGTSISESQLKDFVSPNGGIGSGRPVLTKMFGEDFAEEFCKDPVGIFKSLPKEQRLIVARIATDNGIPGPS